MRIQVIIGHLESGEVEAIACGADLAKQDDLIARLIDRDGVESQRKRYTQIEVITNDHARRRISFSGRPEKIAEREADLKATREAAQKKLDEQNAEAGKRAAKKEADELDRINRTNLRMRSAFSGGTQSTTEAANPVKTTD